MVCYMDETRTLLQDQFGAGEAHESNMVLRHIHIDRPHTGYWPITGAWYHVKITVADRCRSVRRILMPLKQLSDRDRLWC